MRHPIAVEYRGVIYKRNPKAKDRSHRVYYSAPRGVKPTYLHRAIWEFGNGLLPRGMIVHHADGNSFNNELTNLIAVTCKEHARIHAGKFRAKRRAWAEQIRPLTKEWHHSTEGREWHRQHGIESWWGRSPVTMTCIECGQEFQTLVAKGHGDERYCSRKCHARRERRLHTYEHRVPCPVCGAAFWQALYRNEPETCSRKCGAQLRKKRRG